MEFSIPTYGEAPTLDTTRQSAPEPKYVQKRIISEAQRSNDCITRTLEKFNLDTLPDLETGPLNTRDSRLLMKQIEQLRGLTRCLSLTLVILSVIYLITRVSSLMEMKATKGKNTLIGRNKVTMSNIELVHYFTIIHAITCVGISAFMGMSLKKSLHIDRRQYYFLMGLTTMVTVLYFFSLLFVVYYTT